MTTEQPDPRSSVSSHTSRGANAVGDEQGYVASYELGMTLAS